MIWSSYNDFFKLFFTKNVQGATQAISYFGLTHAKDHYLSSNSRIRSIYPAFVWLSVKDDFKMRQEQKSGTQGILATCRFLCELCFFIYGVHQSPWSNVWMRKHTNKKIWNICVTHSISQELNLRLTQIKLQIILLKKEEE